MAVRTILYAFVDDAGKTPDEQRESAEAAGFRIDAVLCEEADFDPRTALLERPRGESLLHFLAHGDTLVVRELTCLAENYAGISGVLHAFMRRGVVVKTIVEAFAFDGATQDPMARAARDALIAFAAARAEAEATKAAKATPPRPRPHIDDEAASPFDRQSALLQLRVSFAQIAVLALVAYWAASSVHGPSLPKLGTPVQEAQLEGVSTTAQRMREGRSARQAPWLDADGETNPRAAPHASPAPAAPEALTLSRDEQLKVLRAVVSGKVVRIRRPSFPLAVGAVLPREIRLAEFPRRLTDQLPHFRGYKFIVVENEVAIVDPETLRVLGIIYG